jgi:hypothetical protein
VSHSPFPRLLVTDAAHKQTIMRPESFIYAARYITSCLVGCQNLHRLQSHPARPHTIKILALNYIVPRLDNRTIEEFEVIPRGTR